MEDTNEFVLFYLCYSAYYIYKYNYYLITVLTTISISEIIRCTTMMTK